MAVAIACAADGAAAEGDVGARAGGPHRAHVAHRLAPQLAVLGDLTTSRFDIVTK